MPAPELTFTHALLKEAVREDEKKEMEEVEKVVEVEKAGKPKTKKGGSFDRCSIEEETCLTEGVTKFGTKWSKIIEGYGEVLGKRTPSAVAQHWNLVMEKGTPGKLKVVKIQLQDERAAHIIAKNALGKVSDKLTRSEGFVRDEREKRETVEKEVARLRGKLASSEDGVRDERGKREKVKGANESLCKQPLSLQKRVNFLEGELEQERKKRKLNDEEKEEEEEIGGESKRTRLEESRVEEEEEEEEDYDSDDIV